MAVLSQVYKFQSYLVILFFGIVGYQIGINTPTPLCPPHMGITACNRADIDTICTPVGCFISPVVTNIGPPRDHLFQQTPTPSYITISHRIGWITWGLYNTTDMATIACINQHTTRNSEL